jgi:hypothetical protein
VDKVRKLYLRREPYLPSQFPHLQATSSGLSWLLSTVRGASSRSDFILTKGDREAKCSYKE